MNDKYDNATDVEKLSASEFSYDEWDKLPRAMRFIYSNAPYNIHPNKYYMKQLIGLKYKKDALRQACKAQIQSIAELVPDEALRLYGPDHPQANKQELWGFL